MIITLSDLQQLSEACEKRATPHRLPHWDKIWQLVDGDPQVRGQLLFIEEHNTGYRGVLHRWLFVVESKYGGPVEFMADLFPHDITART